MFNRNDEGFAERQSKTLQVETWVKDGVIVGVNQAGHLGNQIMPKLNDLEPKLFECIGAYGRPNSKIRVTFALTSLGTIVPRLQTVEGLHAVKTEVMFNALAWLDEPEKVAALSDAEKNELKNIGVIALNDIYLAAVLSHKWTAMADAAQAIMQHASGTQAKFPDPVSGWERNTEVVTGDHTDGALATLAVGEHTLTVGGKYWRFCSYGLCHGRERYAFTWMGVPVAYLDEPHE
jgi:hypothetical protein